MCFYITLCTLCPLYCNNEQNIFFVVYRSYELEEAGIKRRNYSLFVCIHSSYFDGHLFSFRRARGSLIAVLRISSYANRLFSWFVERDSAQSTKFDLKLNTIDGRGSGERKYSRRSLCSR